MRFKIIVCAFFPGLFHVTPGAARQTLIASADYGL